MTIEELKNKLQEGILVFSYVKKNGENRLARGTTSKDYIESKTSYRFPEESNSRVKKENLITYFDLDKNEWRSFNFEQFESAKNNITGWTKF
jgi:hypothetical protein